MNVDFGLQTLLTGFELGRSLFMNIFNCRFLIVDVAEKMIDLVLNILIVLCLIQRIRIEVGLL